MVLAILIVSTNVHSNKYQKGKYTVQFNKCTYAKMHLCKCKTKPTIHSEFCWRVHLILTAATFRWSLRGFCSMVRGCIMMINTVNVVQGYILIKATQGTPGRICLHCTADKIRLIKQLERRVILHSRWHVVMSVTELFV